MDLEKLLEALPQWGRHETTKAYAAAGVKMHRPRIVDITPMRRVAIAQYVTEWADRPTEESA